MGTDTKWMIARFFSTGQFLIGIEKPAALLGCHSLRIPEERTTVHERRWALREFRACEQTPSTALAPAEGDAMHTYTGDGPQQLNVELN